MTSARLCILVLAAACATSNQRPPTDAETSCQSTASCTSPTGVCKLDTGTCVECTTDDHAACVGTKPVCGADNTCQSCTRHRQCASNVCLPDGSCVPSGSVDVVYVDSNYSGILCTKAEPCPLLSTALEKNTKYIKMVGRVKENLVITAKTTMILADPGTQLLPESDGILVEVRDSSLAIYDLELSGATGGIDSHAISMPAGNESTLSLNRVKILNNTGAGISADGGTLNLLGSTIADNEFGGIIMKSPTVFDIRNNFIVRNGDILSSLVGGLKAIPKDLSKLEFNTICDNRALNAASAGVECSGSLPVSKSLVFGNVRGGVQPDNAQIVGCDGATSLQREPDAGAGFRKRDFNDYHLTETTPVGVGGIRDQVECDDNTADIDGDPRPQGGLCDYGADEFTL